MGPQQEFIWNKVSLYSEKGKQLTHAFLQPFPNSRTITLGENDQFFNKHPFPWQAEISQAPSIARSICFSLSIIQALTVLCRVEQGKIIMHTLLSQGLVFLV